MKLPIKASLAALFIAAASTTAMHVPANAEGIELGLLTCSIDGGFGLLVGSSRDMTCVFDPAGNRDKKENYIGQINKLGIDIGVTNASIMKWGVVAAEEYQHAPGQLEGTYAGASASATVAVGLGANVLVGGNRDAIALQPFSIQGQTGLNIAIGVSQLKLAHVK